MTPAITYSAACRDPNLFGPWFGADSWNTWRVLDKALFGEPLTQDELRIFPELTGRIEAPTKPVKEAWILGGRRGGKDTKAASICVYLATIGAELYGFRKRLVRGETGVVQLLAVDRNQAKICFDYARAFFDQPLLAPLLKRETADTLELTNGLAIEVMTADQRRVRGRTVIAAVLDEVAHWRDENSATPDRDIYRAIRPATLTIPNSMVIAISTAHMRRGLFWEQVERYWGSNDERILAVKAPTWLLNPNVTRDDPQVAADYRDDPAYAAAEYEGIWRSDLEAFIAMETVDACTDPETGRPFCREFSHAAFCDPSGGVGDAMTLGVAHMDGEIVVLDHLSEVVPPFSPQAAVERFAEVLRDYNISTVYGDRYSGQWVVEEFALHGILYQPAEQTKSELYLSLLPMLNSHIVALLTNDKMRRQLLSLERRAVRGGRDTVDHPRNQHDDLANAVAGALVHAKLVPGAVAPPGFNRKLDLPNLGVV